MGERGGFAKRPTGFATKSVHVGHNPDDWPCAPIVAPLVMASTFKQSRIGVKPQGYGYGRDGNPTRTSVEQTLAELEGAKFAVTYASGMAAVSGVSSILSTGSHILISQDLYGGSTRYFTTIARRFGMETEFIDVTDLSGLAKAMKPNTRMVWFESPTNPTLKVVDIKAICDTVHKRPNVIAVIDNTFLTPFFQCPLELGADISMYSLTKYMNGHSDVIMGAAVTNCEKLYKELSFVQQVMGAVPSPYDCLQLFRSLKTLPLRMEKHEKNSLAVAEFLAAHPAVKKVNHPALPTHPDHKLALKQSFGHSGIMSFEIRGGEKEVEKFIDNLKLLTLGTSLGGPESLVGYPVKMSHEYMPPEEQKKIGLTDSLIRVSIGLEDADELIQDLDQALKRAVA